MTATITKGVLTAETKVFSLTVLAETIPPTIYTVTFDSQGGTPTLAPITGITSGATVTLPDAPTKTGNTFASWNTEAGGGGTAFTGSTQVIANLTVYAQWTLDIINISAAGVTGFVAPVKGAVPLGLGALAANAATYTKTSLGWSPTDNPYLGHTVYTANVVLTSASGYKFPMEGIAVPTAVSGGGIVSAGTVGGGDVSGNTLTFSVTFPVTAYFVIGESYQGGKIAYIDNTGEHGLIAAPSDQSTGIIWGNAVTLCADLVLGSYSDWYLPSKDELNKLYLNMAAVGGFASAYYWSSSENDSNSNYAWIQSFGDGYQYFLSKDYTAYVRAVRAF